MSETPQEIRARQTETALRILPSVFENPIRLRGETCDLCTGPLETVGPHCSQCRAALAAWPGVHVDAVVPLTFAGPRSLQAKQDLRQYKDGGSVEVRSTAAYRLAHLVWYFAAYHAKCLTALYGRPDLVALVPSGKAGARSDGHPLVDLDFLPRKTPRLQLVRVRDAYPRAVDPGSLRVDGDVEGKRIVLFDDTWTTGASIQTAAVAVKRAGATHVTAVVIGRWLNGGWSPTDALMSRHDREPWRPDVCPVTGGACP